MSPRPITIFLSAAEASGDEHAARLIGSLRARLNHVRFVGAAGEQMAAGGCEVLADLTAQASMLGGPVLRLGYYLRQLRRLKKAMRDIRPDVFVPVDSPALNWHLAAQAKGIGCPVMYFISPQVWAWAPWRVKKLSRLTDRVACILPFEQPYLCDRGVRATFVGHPLMDALPPPGPPSDLIEAYADGTWRVALLAGSRAGEIAHHAPALVGVAKEIQRRWPRATCTFAAKTKEAAQAIALACDKAGAGNVPVLMGHTHEVLAGAHVAIVTSGTVTLEAAYFGVPMVIFYRTSRLLGAMHRLLGRWAVPTRFLSLVNILAGRALVPELMPWHGNVRKVTGAAMEMMEDLGRLCQMRQQLLELVGPLRAASGTAADNAAQLVLELVGPR